MNPLPTDPLDLTILLFKHMPDGQVVDGELNGKVDQNIDFDALLIALRQADLLIHNSAVNRTLECTIAPGFFPSLDDLLAAAERRITVPSRFYLADSDTFYYGRIQRVSATTGCLEKGGEMR